MKEKELSMSLEDFTLFVMELKKTSKINYPEFDFKFDPDYLIALFPKSPELAFMSATNFHMVLQSLN